AVHGSSPGPSFPDSRALYMPAGFDSTPFRPRNSILSPVIALVDVFASKKATLSGNSELKALRAKTDPVRGSASVTTCMIDFGRVSPSTHSTYPVADSRRLR